MAAGVRVNSSVQNAQGLDLVPDYKTQPSSPLRQHRRSKLLPWPMDMLCLSAVMIWVVLTSNASGAPLSVETLILLRVSVVNLLLAIICLGSWRASRGFVQLLLPELEASAALAWIALPLKVGVYSASAAMVLKLRHPERALTFPVLRFALLSLLLLAACRLFREVFTQWISPALRLERKVLIVGTGARALALAETIKAHARWRYSLIGFVDNEPQFKSDRVLGSLLDMDSLLMRLVVDEVFIALPIKSKYDEIQMAIAACERAGIQSGYSMDFFVTEVAKRRSAFEQDGSVVLHMVHNDNRQHLKRALDIVGALFGLVLLSPVLLAVALAVRLTSKGPVLFRQSRYGLNKRIFSMYKFRSMVVDAEQQQGKLEHLNEAGGPVFKLRADPRITAVGRWIRKTSVDELPQLVNVLRGDMSLVGPRPLPTRDVSRFSEAWLMRRFSVRPGLTGLWQVSGRSDTTFAHWIQLDLQYIDTWSLALDLQIIARTFPAVLKRQGAA